LQLRLKVKRRKSISMQEETGRLQYQQFGVGSRQAERELADLRTVKFGAFSRRRLRREAYGLDYRASR
jgi:hypothetical protein